MNDHQDLERRLTDLFGRVADEVGVADAVEEDSVVTHLTSSESPSDVDARHRRVVAGAAAAVLLVVAVVAIVARSGDGDDGVPATNPPSTESLHSIPAGAPQRLSKLPVIDHPDVSDSDVRASYTQVGWGNPPSVSALVAHRDGDTLSDAIEIEVGEVGDGYTAPPPTTRPLTSDTITIHGRTATVSVEEGPPTRRTVTFEGDPQLTVIGVDPVGFLELAGPGAIRVSNEPVNTETPFSLAIGDLPPSYEVVAPPEPVHRGALGASMHIDGIGGADGLLVEASSGSPRLGRITYGEEPSAVDIDGVEGWVSSFTSSSGTWWSVTWEPVENVAVTVAPAPTRELALDIARSITMVDEPRWQQRYNAGEPEFGGGPDVTLPGSVQPDEPIATIDARSDATSPRTDIAELCRRYETMSGEQPESYVGSAQHIADLEGLIQVGPASIQESLRRYRDFLQTADRSDSDWNVTENWPQPMRENVDTIQAFLADTC